MRARSGRRPRVRQLGRADHRRRPADLVRAVVLLAAGHKGFAQAVRDSLTKCFDLAAPREERITALKHAFFAPGHDPTAWLEGWYPELALAERAAAAATHVEQWWSAGTAPILDVQAREDAFAPHAASGKLRAELGERVTIAVIPDAGHALLPRTARRRWPTR